MKRFAKRCALALVSIGLLASIAVHPFEGHAESETAKINRQLQQLKDRMKAADKRADQAKSRLQSIHTERTSVKKDLAQLDKQMNSTSQQISAISAQIEQIEDKLKQTGKELEQAGKKVEERDKQAKTRIRSMYMNGSVSYLDVLFSSKSFSDFLDRFDAMRSMVTRDKQVLKTRKESRDQIARKKRQVNEDLAKVEKLYTKLIVMKQDLADQTKEKEVRVASLTQEEQSLVEVTEEQEKVVMQLAREQAKLLEKKNKLKTKYKKGSKLGLPLNITLRITSGFGHRTDPVTGKKGAMHKGVDFGAPKGTDIFAAADGIVIVAEFYRGYGNCVILDHGNGLWTVYGHIRDGGIKVKKGETVKRGQKIAEVGSTGKSTGYHLHFEVRLNEEAVNPLKYLPL